MYANTIATVAKAKAPHLHLIARHFLLWCLSYVLPRKKNEALHQPYEEYEENKIGKLLFGNKSKKNKETIYEFRKNRETKLKEIDQHS